MPATRSPRASAPDGDPRQAQAGAGARAAAEAVCAAASNPDEKASAMMKPARDGSAIGRLSLITIGLVMLLAGCERGNAEIGPNPGGGFYSPSNIDNGRVNP